MITRLLQRWQSALAGWRKSRELARASRLAQVAQRLGRRQEELAGQFEEALEHLEERSAEADAMIREAQETVQRAAAEATAARQRLAESMERNIETIEELRAKLRIAEDVTIPTLVAQHKLILERYDAETAIEVRRRMATKHAEEE